MRIRFFDSICSTLHIIILYPCGSNFCDFNRCQLRNQLLFAVMDHLKPPQELDLSSTGSATIVEWWRQWKQKMQLFIELSMKDKSEKEKCSIFLYTIGQTGRIRI